ATRILPIFQYRFGNGVQKAKRIIDRGLAGRPYLATAETAWNRTPDYYGTPWRGRWESARGGVLLSQAIHLHDLLTYLLGPVASVFARTATRVNPVEVEDCAVASLVMRSGALASLAATLGSHKEISRLRLCFEHVTFESGQAPYSPGDDRGRSCRPRPGRGPNCRGAGRPRLRAVWVRGPDRRLPPGTSDG